MRRDSSIREVAAFAAVGTVGFVVDTAVLYLAMAAFDIGVYAGRMISYFVAATTTWGLNRRFTFYGRRSDAPIGEWGRFLGANAFGGGVNYLAFALVAGQLPSGGIWPGVAVAVGSIAGLAVNYSLSRRWVFVSGR